jgi:hypothetical protein
MATNNATRGDNTAEDVARNAWSGGVLRCRFGGFDHVMAVST